MRELERTIVRRAVLLVVFAAVIAGLALLTLALLPDAGPPLPTVIWVRGTGDTSEQSLGPADVRVGTPSGPSFGAFERGSQGRHLTLRRPRTPRERLQRHLARHQLIPSGGKHYGGYELTGRAAKIDGEAWHEFRLFSATFEWSGYSRW